jgi:hypothetical protein
MQLSTYFTSQGLGLLARHPLVYGQLVICPCIHRHEITHALEKIATTGTRPLTIPISRLDYDSVEAVRPELAMQWF